MKRIVISLITVVVMFVLLIPTASPPPVAAGAVAVDFTQYANEDDEWINGILNKNNSKYRECMSVPQRTILADIASTTDDVHTFTFKHEATKSGTHAYDWLTAYNQGNEPPLGYDECGENIGHTPDFATICEDLHTSGYSILVDVPDDPFISKDGSTQDRINAYEAKFGNRQIKIYGNELITAANLTLSHDLSNGVDDSDSYIDYVLTWTSNSTQILIEMAGHLAASGDPAINPIAWGPGLGASQISGGPYHFKLDKLDGATLGSQDNQIKGADILPLVGTIVAHKFNDLNANGSQDAGEDDLEGWIMTLYEGLDCTGDPVDSGTTGSDGNAIFDGLEAGNYSVKETLKDCWTNTTELCQQVTIKAGDTATLDFGNVELKPDIDVEKTASPTSGAASTNVTFTITVENTGDLTLDPVKVVDILPEGMTYVSTGTSPAPDSSKHNGDGTWTITWNNVGYLDPGNTTTIYLVAHIDGDVLGTLTNEVTATGTPPCGDDVEDTDTANVKVYHADIDVEKTADPTVGVASTNVTFTITVTNTNGCVLDPVIVVDTLPDGMSYVSDDRGGTESPEGTITWDIGALASGNSTTIHLVASIDGDKLGTVTNTVTATGTPPYGDDVEDTDTADVLVIDTRISISPLEATNVIGDDHELTAKVEVNDGSGWQNAQGVTVYFTKTAGVGNLNPLTDVTDANGEAKTTLTSNVTGNTTVQASANVTVEGVAFTLVTDGTGQNSEPAEKTWVDARISISPPDAANVIGDEHELTAKVEVNDGTGWQNAQDVTVHFTKTAGVGNLNPLSDVTDANGEATTILTSTEAGNSTVQASANVTVKGVPFNLVTDGTGENSEPAQKTWVNARISISPLEATNAVGDDHVLTAKVEVNDGSGWQNAQDVTVYFTKTAGVGSLDPLSDVTDATGEATTTLTSNVTGNTTVQASANVTVKGVPFTLVTDSTGQNSEPAEKTWVDARISISPLEATNVIGDEHELTAKVEVNDGTGWEDAQGVTVHFTKTAGVGNLNPLTDVTDASGEATTILTSTEAGNSTVQASANVTVEGVAFTLVTNGTGENSEPAEKTWVDARISISPLEATNVIGDEHVLTATVEVNDGTGWQNAQDVTVYFHKTAGVGNLDPLTDVTDASGEATTILTSTEAGNSTVQASANVTVEGVPFILVTDGEVGEFNAPAQKIWIEIGARISIYESGVNPVGTPHTFTVHVEKNEGQGAGWVDVIGVSVDGTISGVGSITSTLPAITDGNGEITITVNSTVAGTATVHASATVSVNNTTIDVATNGYGRYYVSNTKTWTSEPRGGPSGCPCQCGFLTVDWEGNNTTKPLYTNDKLAVDLLGPSPDISDSLFLERGTHAPVVGERTYYLIVVRELDDIPPVPEGYEAIVVLNITPTDAEFNKDIFLTVGLNETQLPQNVLNLTMVYYNDVNRLWENLDYEAGGPNGVAEITLSAPINHFSIYGVLAKLGETPTPTPPAHFVPSGLSIVPGADKKISAFVTKTGESVTITANVANDGGQEGTYSVVLKLNGQTIDTKTVTIGAGQSKQVSFTRSGLDYGQYDVNVAGLTGEFTTSRTITWWLIILIIVAIGLIIWGVVWGRRRGRKAKAQPET